MDEFTIKILWKVLIYGGPALYMLCAYLNKSWEDYNNTGIKFLNSGAYAKSIEYFNKALEKNINADLPYYNRALAEYFLGSFKEAEKDYTKAISLNSHDCDYYYRRALARFELKKYKDANNDCHRVFDFKSTNQDILQDTKKLLQQIENKMPSNSNNTQNDKGNGSPNKKTKKENKIVVDTIKIATCTKEELLAVSFDENKIDLFLNERNTGKMWYDIDSFAIDFNLQPHEVLNLQDKLIFPPKAKVKHGRKVDW